MTQPHHTLTPSLVSSSGRDVYHIEGSRFHLIYRKNVTQRNDASYIEITDEDESNLFFSVYTSEGGDTLYVHPERAHHRAAHTALKEDEALVLLQQSALILKAQENADIIIRPRTPLPPMEMDDMLAENKAMYKTVRKLNLEHKQAGNKPSEPNIC